VRGLGEIHEMGRRFQAEQRAWEAEQRQSGAVPVHLSVSTDWIRDCRESYSTRCPVCHDFGGAKEYQFTRADRKLWMCGDCFELIFGESAGAAREEGGG
jgi:hypothetical protein